MQDKLSKERSSGILLHITSLPSSHGIGDLGSPAINFIDYLSKMNQKFWQILPTNYPENFNSPYDSNSAFANNPLLISLESLIDDGFLLQGDIKIIPSFTENRVDFENVKKWKYPILEKAANNFYNAATKNDLGYQQFCQENSFWLDDYAVFKLIKNLHNNGPWKDWNPTFRKFNKKLVNSIHVKHSVEIHKLKILQYFFYTQWMKIKNYAKKKDIKLIGDIPIYISYNSADVWSNSKLFKLNNRGSMKFQSGCPPDHFSSKGQLWGHPIYDWEKHLNSGFQWWKSRLRHALRFVDVVRIDHFNGLAKYWEVPIKNRTAKKGKWVYAPGKELLSSMYKEDKNSVQIIAEDLGAAAKDAEKIREKFGIPGMTILQYEYFNNKNSFLNVEDTVLYTGTHDNDTIVGWYLDFIKKSSKKMVNLIPNFKDIPKKETNWFFIDIALKSKAKVVIIPFQDIIGLGTDARMNIPGTTDTKNWTWRASKNHMEEKLINRMKKLMQNSNRL